MVTTASNLKDATMSVLTRANGHAGREGQQRNESPEASTHSFHSSEAMHVDATADNAQGNSGSSGNSDSVPQGQLVTLDSLLYLQNQQAKTQEYANLLPFDGDTERWPEFTQQFHYIMSQNNWDS